MLVDRLPPAGDRLLAMGDLAWRVLVCDMGDAARPVDLASAIAHGGWRACRSAPRTLAQALMERGLEPGSPDWPELDTLDFWCRAEVKSESLVAPGADARLWLDLPGLATLAEVWWNGVLVCRSDNMFVGHTVALDLPLPAQNELVMRFRPLAAEMAKRRPRPAWRAPMVPQQQLRWWRTSLLGRTPGWSPPTAVVGAWRGLSLRAERSLSLVHWDFRSTVAVDGSVRLEAEAGVAVMAPRSLQAVRLILTPVEAAADAFTIDLPLHRNGADRWVLNAKLDAVERWWPHTHGRAQRYAAHLSVTRDRPAAETRLELGHVGFRRVELDDRAGRFALRINGEPVFCRGACWTPPNVTDPDDESEVCAALEQLRDAGANMVRLPGNMLYPGQGFYDACDRLGILVWQELMFANMDYPETDEAFCASVDQEVAQLMSRLQGRPSVAVVCGNSEGSQQAAMWGAPRDKHAPALFTRHLREQVERALPGVVYWPSSAWGGEGFPQQWNQGTTSYYGVGAYLRGLDDARRSDVSFATECLAFANVPDDATLARSPGGAGVRVHQPEWRARSPRDLGAGWDFDDVRDHYLRVLYGVDPVALRYSDHARYLAMSRAVSGEVMTAAYSEWRRAGSTCGGALVWFLRDLWAGAGWGVLDDRGRPKACFHALRRVWQPRTVVLTDEGGSGLYAHVINEGPSPGRLALSVRAFRPDGALVEHGSTILDVAKHQTIAIPIASLFDRFVDLNWAYRFGPALASVVLVTLDDAETGTACARAFHFPMGQGTFGLGDPGLQAHWRPVSDEAVEVTISTQRFAQSVHLDTPGFLPEDDYFHLEPGGRLTLRCTREVGSRALPFRGSVAALNAAIPVSFQATA